MELIIGIDGMVGGALYREALARGQNANGTSRRHGSKHHFLDLEKSSLDDLPVSSVAYICAGIVGYKNCEGNPQSYRVNVDGTLRLIKKLQEQGAFIVFMSSDAVECMLTTSYGLHKALVETYLRSVEQCAIVRSGRIEKSTLPEICDLLLKIGGQRLSGIFNFIPGK
jgi:nucleoside-diphosphate-sugar epimerase